MRRLARWLFTLLSAVSLVLCVAIVVLCGRKPSPSRFFGRASDLGVPAPRGFDVVGAKRLVPNQPV